MARGTSRFDEYAARAGLPPMRRWVTNVALAFIIAAVLASIPGVLEATGLVPDGTFGVLPAVAAPISCIGGLITFRLLVEGFLPGSPRWLRVLAPVVGGLVFVRTVLDQTVPPRGEDPALWLQAVVIAAVLAAGVVVGLWNVPRDLTNVPPDWTSVAPAPAESAGWRTVSIKGLDPALVLVALYNNARLHGRGIVDPRGSAPLTVDQAREELKTSRAVDYLRGRVIKVDFHTDEILVDSYDRDNGWGKAERVISNLRATGSTSEII